MARFYSNENIASQVVMELRRLGHDVLTSLEAGNANASVCGIVLCTFDADFTGQANRIDAAVTALPDCADQVIRINRPA